MKNVFVLMLALFCSMMVASAQLRTEQEALGVAKSFINSSSGQLKSDNPSLQLTYAPSMIDPQQPSTEKVYYYVYNLGDNEGFVIVSGDERAKQILGYSNDGNFDIHTVSDNLKYWLSVYEDELDFMTTLPTEETVLSPALKSTTEQSDDSFAPFIAPMVKAKWNQDAPYNYDCPVIPGTANRSMVGCTAIASGQIMSYYQWPKTGKGSLTQTIFNKSLTVDFSKASYDWDKIRDFYSPTISVTNETAKAVAQFLYHVSFAIKTTYGESSGAYTKDMARALMDYFDYDQNIQIYRRDYYTKDEWERLIKTELNASRPIHYAGYANELGSGHAFVCDGYDENGLFHFNWGWEGSSNGYFELSALSPGIVGIGAGSGSYNRNQEIITGIQPARAQTESPTYLLHLKNLSLNNSGTIGRQASIGVRANGLFNYGIHTFSGQFALGLFDENGLVQVFSAKSVSNLEINYGWNQSDFTGTLPLSVQNGNYKLYAVYKANSQTEWSVLRGKAGVVNHYNVSVTSNNIVLTEPVEDMPKLEVVVDNSVQELYAGKSTHIELVLKNTGGGEYNSFISVAYDPAGTNLFMSKIPVVLAAGETKRFLITGNASKPFGDYNLYVLYDKENAFSTNITTIANENNPLKVRIISMDANVVNLTLTSQISFPNYTNVTPNTFALKVSIKNSGDYYEGNIYAASGNAAGSYSSFDHQYVFLEPNEEITLYFTNPPSTSYGAVRIGVFYEDKKSAGTEWFAPNANCFSTITYRADPTGIESITTSQGEEVTVYPNPVEDVLRISSQNPVRLVTVYDLSGKKILDKQFDRADTNYTLPVHNMDKGLYLIHIKTDMDSKTIKFRKN